MARFRKKPVVIEARQFTGTIGQDGLNPAEQVPEAHELAAWCGGQVRFTYDNAVPVPHIEITTLEGVMHADPGDWIIQGVQGEFYPCKPGIFEQSYEAVDG